MAVGAILDSVVQSTLAATNSVSKFKQFQQELQQLGRDLQSGNLAQAQTDFVTLEKNSPFLQAATAASSGTAAATSSAPSSSPIVQVFSQLSKDLQAGNLSTAQGDFATIQQDFQNAQSQSQSQSGGGHHHYHFASSSSQGSPLAQLLSQLGQALQTGSLTGAQQAYSALQQDFQQFTTGSAANGGSVNASA